MCVHYTCLPASHYIIQLCTFTHYKLNNCDWLCENPHLLTFTISFTTLEFFEIKKIGCVLVEGFCKAGHYMLLISAVGRRVRLMINKECVGIAKIVDGKIHGHTIPRDFIKVMLDAIKPGLTPEMKGPFEDDYLCIGQFTVWPLNQMECM